MFNKKKAEEEKDNQSAQNGARSTTDTSVQSRVKPITQAAQPGTTASPVGSPFPLNKEAEPVKAQEKGSRLHVGRDIHLKGEITACDRLIVEGKVEASMNSNEIEISQSGIFNGEVIIDTADISGEFEGTLTARTRLIIRKTGRVSGDIQYGEIEIEPGGEISGNLSKTGQKSADQKKADVSLSDKVITRKMKNQAASPAAHH
ncbi:MAG: polymer-forming cytoskeletal protein [Sneathiella sp.]